MNTYSTCVTCGELMRVIRDDQKTHPTCGDSADYGDTLLRQFVEAARVDDAATCDALDRRITDFDHSPPQFLKAALYYTGWGWPVFPLRDGEKIPRPACRECFRHSCTGCDHELCHGFKDATTDADTVRQWWARHPTANIGIATGVAFDAIDVDVPEGTPHWVTLRDDPDTMPDIHGINTTPSGGFHVLVDPTGAGCTTRAFPGIDYRGLGGYIVAPPSVRSDKNHRRYRWGIRPSPHIRTRQP
ncbi:bifunctional DNA primase/polymerase [Actinopolyspora halophila]|uniref:bifunctional DNA primase/polymerase n=1 Tax=Actinopolyspora halophila TaxID=1850 RepID=UPI00035E830D|nr:bifunctional DNA primase/polymerase [Actinopolyspora halophila]